MTTEDGSDQVPAEHDPDPHMGEVPEKQLHRWKGEGGALLPEPAEEPGKEPGQESGDGDQDV